MLGIQPVITIFMIVKLCLLLAVMVAVMGQITSQPAQMSQSFALAGNSESDIDEDEAQGVIKSLFGNNTAALNSLRASSAPAPTSAPSGAILSSAAPSSSQRATLSSSTGSSMLYPGNNWITPNNNWGRWVRVLRCTYNNYSNGSFCCRWVWIWRYW